MAGSLEAPSWDVISRTFAESETDTSVEEAYRALFQIRSQCPSVGEAADMLQRAFFSRACKGSMLLMHEVCYNMGQLGARATSKDKVKIGKFLLWVLDNEALDEVTRHEAAEGLGAVTVYDVDAQNDNSHDQHETIALNALRIDTYEVLQRNSNQETPLGQTCYLAVKAIDDPRHDGRICACLFQSYDPALGDPNATTSDISKFYTQCADPLLDLFDRYVAMFTLRNLGAVEELAKILLEDQSTPVLRHEICFVLGQMENEVATRALELSLLDEKEHVMSRHEAAIALGSIGADTSVEVLQKLSNHSDPMVAESCRVALATKAYWDAWEALENRIKGE